MERRDEVRFPVRAPIEFTILGREESPQISAMVDNVSEGGIRLATSIALTPGLFLRLRLDDSTLFGEVRYCCPWVGGYLAGLYVERVLVGNSDLSRLMALTLNPVKKQIDTRRGTEQDSASETADSRL